MAEEIHMWKSTDGSLHDTQEKAEKQDLRLECIEYFNKNKLYGPYIGCTLEGREIMKFVDEHKEILTKYLTTKWKEITQ